MIDRNDESVLFPLDEEKHRRILEGLADVDAGRTIPHAEARAWFEKMGSLTGGLTISTPTVFLRKFP